MGSSDSSLICQPGQCMYSDTETEDNCPSTVSYGTDFITPSAIKGGSAWEQAAKISQDISQDIKITVSVHKTDIDLSWINKSSVTTTFKIEKVKQLLLELHNLKGVDQRETRKSGESLNKVHCEGRMQSCSQDSSLETYDLTLPSWSDIWRLKCAVAQLSGTPARYQFLLRGTMTAESALEHNHPAASLWDLTVQSEHPKKRKSQLPGKLSFNISGQKNSSTNGFTSSSGLPQSTLLNLIICVPLLLCSSENLQKVPSIDCSDKSSQTGASFCRTSESSDRGQQELQPPVDLKCNLDSSDRNSENGWEVQTEDSEISNSGNIQKEPSGEIDSKSHGLHVGASIEDFALEDLSDDVVEPCALKEKKVVDQPESVFALKEQKEIDHAEVVFLKMKMLSGKADLIQVMVGLPRLGCERPTLGQARMLFESVGCSVTDCITPDHIRLFLQSSQQGEDSWLSNVRELMASSCNPDLRK